MRKVLCLFSVLTLSGCWLLLHPPMYVNAVVTADSHGTIVFHVREQIRDRYFRREQYLLGGIDVYDESGLKQPNARLIWKVRPMGQRVPELPPAIAYGKVPDGMVEVVKSEPLQPGIRYSADIGITGQTKDGKDQIGFPASASFWLGYDQGKMVILERPAPE